MLEAPRGAFWGLGLEGTAPAHTEQTLPRHQPGQTKEENKVVRKYVWQMRQGTRPRLYGGWPKIAISAFGRSTHGCVHKGQHGTKKPIVKGTRGRVAHGHQESNAGMG